MDKWIEDCTCEWNQEYKDISYKFGLKKYPPFELCFCGASDKIYEPQFNVYQEGNRLVKELGELGLKK